MYGYVRPLKGELKVSEYESFQSVYCGLCHALKKRGGFAARFVVNYDFTFLAMLLSSGNDHCIEKKRCPARLWGKRRCLCGNPALELAADDSLILSWWKLKDSVSDKGFFAGFGYRLAMLFLSRAYKQAALRQPDFAKAAEENIAALAALEAGKCASLDAVADKFALILRAAAQTVSDEKRRRALEELMYHLGRTIYILDAVDDLPEDARSGSYNPLLYRFRPQNGKLSPEEQEELRGTVRHSVNLVSAAYELLDKVPWAGILENTIYLGLPWVSEAVFSGRWREMRKINKHRTDFK